MRKLLLSLSLLTLSPAFASGSGGLIADEYLGEGFKEKFAAFRAEMCPGFEGELDQGKNPCGQAYFKMINAKILQAYPKADVSKALEECQALGPQCQTLSQTEALIKKSHKANVAREQRRAFWDGVAVVAGGVGSALQASAETAPKEKIEIECRESLLGNGTYNCEGR